MSEIRRSVVITVSGIVVIALGVVVWLIFGNHGPAANNGKTSVDNSKVDKEAPVIKLILSEAELASARSGQPINVSVEATDNHMIARVEYLVDGQVMYRTVESPFKATLDVANLSPGEHTLQAVAYDGAGNIGKSEVVKFTVGEAQAAPTPAPQADNNGGGSDGSGAIAQKPSSGSSSPPTPTPAPTPTPTPAPTPTPTPTDPLADPGRGSGGWYTSAPAQICSNQAASWGNGPATAPVGAITVPAGDNEGFSFNQSNKTFWFAPGDHTFGLSTFGQINPGSGSTYIGAPGAVLNGNNKNLYAFVGSASNVRVAYLEIKNFGRGNDNNNEGVVNHDSGTGWTMEYLNVHNNDGAGVFIGTNNIVRYSCLKDNGQYGFSMFKDQVEGDSAIKNITLDHNEISGNNQDDWETQIPGCGCTGGGKFWDVKGATVTNNYVHDNLSTGLWADTDDIDFKFDSNWIEHNSGEGIWYEISYNATMSRNVLKRNAWVSGNSNTGSPGPAIYISESGGDSRLQSTTSGSTDLRINNNLIQDNFSGISIFESSNRFCNSNGNTSTSYCTPFVSPTILSTAGNTGYPNPIDSSHHCYTDIGTAPYTFDCRWHSQNVQVYNNEFRFDDTVVPCAGTYCGVQALFATGANNIPWAPAAYNVSNVQNDVMFNNNNKFHDNTYVGNWRFAKGSGEKIYFPAWQAGPYLQDTGSTFDGATTPPPVANALDTDTATLEGSIGQWESWFSATPSQTTEDAHTGTHSLKETVTSGGGWASDLANYPGFAATPGSKHVTFWAKQGTGAISSVSLRVRWLDGSGTLLQTDIVPRASLSATWQQGVADVTAPAGTASVFVELFSSSGSTGNTLYADDFIIADQ